MTPTPYVLNASRADGKFSATLSCGPDVVGDSKDDFPQGIRSEKDLNEWARQIAVTHKASVSPREVYTVQRSFVV